MDGDDFGSGSNCDERWLSITSGSAKLT